MPQIQIICCTQILLLSAVFVTAVDKENSSKTPQTLSHIYICICICICSPWTPRTLCWCCLSALSRECLQSRLFPASKTEEGRYFHFFSECEMIYKQHFQAVQYNMTIWHLNCGVEKLNHRVESVQERVKAMENHLLLGCGGNVKKNSKKKDLHLKHLAKNLKATIK